MRELFGSGSREGFGEAGFYAVFGGAGGAAAEVVGGVEDRGVVAMTGECYVGGVAIEV
jgi:hypothetical protein